MISMPRSAKKRGAQASSSSDPLAKPWYATSKKGRWPLRSHRSAIAAHCWRVGSTPVGLCAQPARHQNHALLMR